MKGIKDVNRKKMLFQSFQRQIDLSPTWIRYPRARHAKNKAEIPVIWTPLPPVLTNGLGIEFWLIHDNATTVEPKEWIYEILRREVDSSLITLASPSSSSRWMAVRRCYAFNAAAALPAWS
jgi:hypothetical protein